MEKPTHVKTQIRIPAELYARIEEAKAETGRSLNGELVHRLQTSVASDSPASRKLSLALKEFSDASAKVAAMWNDGVASTKQRAAFAEAIDDMNLWKRQVDKLSP